MSAADNMPGIEKPAKFLECVLQWGGCGRWWPLGHGPAKCPCGSDQGVFPYVETTIFKKAP